ncbi:MAG: GerW family sporulation protein, partial [Clostridia bacterium]|nr:GerW family sporulation protein [Clostridia bacterium]
EYGKINIFKNSSDLPYSAGNGAIISIKPCGFLINENNNYKILSVLEKPYEKMFDKITDIISGMQNEKNN